MLYNIMKSLPQFVDDTASILCNILLPVTRKVKKDDCWYSAKIHLLFKNSSFIFSNAISLFLIAVHFPSPKRHIFVEDRGNEKLSALKLRLMIHSLNLDAITLNSTPGGYAEQKQFLLWYSMNVPQIGPSRLWDKSET